MDWIALIGTFVLPMLTKCLTKTSAENPQAILRSHYDAATNTMNPDLVREAMPQVRRAARKAHRQASPADRKTFPRLTESQVYGIAESKMIEGMKADASTVAGIMAAADLLQDDE